MKLAWGARVSQDFRRINQSIAQEIGADPSELMACIAFETGGTFSPSVKNAAGSSGTGLIQFMRDTAIGLGTTVEDLAKMTAEEQLDIFVRKYFRPYRGRVGTLSDLYMAILKPTAIGKPEDFALIVNDGGKAYVQNKGLDLNKDGNITKSEATSHVAKRLAEGLQAGNVFDDMTQPAAPIEDRGTEILQEDQPMGAVALPLLAQLIPQVLGLFTGRAQAVIAEKTGADPKVAADFMQAMISQVGHAVGVPVVDNATATQAVAALTATPPADLPVRVKALEAQAVATLDALAKALDKTAEWDERKWAAAISGRTAASTVAIEEHKAGMWDMTRTVVYTACAMLTVISTGLLAAILVQAMTGDRKIDGALIGLAGPIWMATIAAWGAMIAYRFDGTKEGAEQSRALIKRLPEAGAQA